MGEISTLPVVNHHLEVLYRYVLVLFKYTT